MKVVGEMHWSFKYILEVTFAKGEGICNNEGIKTIYLIICTYEMRSNNQWSEHKSYIWGTGSILLTLAFQTEGRLLQNR